MEKQEVTLPKTYANDLPRNVDPIAGHLDQLTTNLVWIDQYRLNVEYYLKNTDQVSGINKELAYLKHATDTAIGHLRRLTELLLAGHAVDLDKHLPPNILLPPERGAVKSDD